MSNEVELENEFEVSIEDDSLIVDDVVAPLDTDDSDGLDGDIEEVRRKAKEKLSASKKAWQDERRDKEAALRIADEATNLAKSFQARSLGQQKQLVSGEQYLIAQSQEKARQEVAMAKRAYKEAYESGDSDALAEANELLSRATTNAMQVEQWKPTQQKSLQELENDVQVHNIHSTVSQPAPVMDEKAQKWSERNVWFGKEDSLGKKMTAYALAVHQTLLDDSVDPTSDTYYKLLDGEMRDRFPEGFSRGKPATVVASVQRSAVGKKITLTQTQVSLARRLGITNEQYARELLKTKEAA